MFSQSALLFCKCTEGGRGIRDTERGQQASCEGRKQENDAWDIEKVSACNGSDRRPIWVGFFREDLSIDFVLHMCLN
jgi:hypothetical protein